ncbi:phosphate/phosphite/phosphonate ABC transporter substrate-binding protein [Pelagibacteraceae bacterium]|jgi:phosphonate transport system substrate-binding protein|nr:phosphate/phosphite/phosphonate ABC transporter substrate-binding protein [Pelagibacteraceae bacterium]MDC1158672.1 phosphate/phosphite/phosphonate ABC transporter substrate-binding protein [Pelagibacteraceae bacterium]
MHTFKKTILTTLIFFAFTTATISAEIKKFNMVFVPASEKGDENDYKGLVEIVNNLTGFKINFIKVTDYNAAVEAMRADRAQIAWYGGKTYIKAAELANAEAFAAGVRPGEKDAGYYAYFVVRADSDIKKFTDIKGKVLSLNSIGSTSGDLIPQVELVKINLSTTDENDFKNVFYAGSHDACLLAVLNKQADVCGMSSRNYEARLTDKTFKKNEVRIVHKSDRVPPPPLAYSKKIPLEDRKKIQKAVLEAHKHGEIGGYGGKMSHYISVKDSDYDVLRNVVKLLNKR